MGNGGTVAPRAPRGRLIQTAPGGLTAAFGPGEWALVAAVAAIWGSSFMLIEIGLQSFRPGLIAMLRLSLGAAALAFIPRARRPVEREDLPRVVVLGLTWMGIPLILFPLAQQWVDSAVAGMINGAVPLAAAAWSTVLLRRWPGRAQRFGILIGFAGVVAISWPEVRVGSGSALGVGLVVLAVILYGLATNVAVPLQQKYGSLPVLLRAQLASLLVVVPFGLWSLPGSSFAWGPALAMLPLGVLSTGIAFWLMTNLVGRVGAARGTVAIYFVPLVAIALGVLLLGERLSPFALLGTALVLGGAFLTSRRES